MPPFAKPKAKGDDFEFQLPEQLGGRGRIPKGTDYIGRLTDISADTSKSSGNPMWVWTFIIVKGPHAGRDFKLWTVLNDDSAWKVVETLKALGVEAEAGEKISINRKKLIGTLCRLKIADDEYNGNETSKLQGVAAHPSGAGYRGKFADEDTTPIDQPEEEEEEEEEAEEEEQEEEEEAEEEEEEEPVRKKKPAPSKSGKAAPTLGKKKGKKH